MAQVPGVRLVNLQKGFGSEQLAAVRSWNVLDFGNRLDEAGGFLDTAAVMKHLDLVVTSDTALVHLAGALGVPVWLASSTAADWRWLQERSDSPWYPTLRLFRQARPGDWDEVFTRMAGALELHPRLESAERHAQRGLALLNAGQAPAAAAALGRALELEPKNAVLHNNRAVALDKDGKKAEALAGFAEAVRLKPDYFDALHNLGNMLRRMGRLAEAETHYRAALKLQPDVPALCNHLGIALLGQAQHAEAEACFRRCLRLDPANAEAHNNLGVLFEQVGKIAESIAAYEESLRLKPDSADTHKNLALGWLTAGDYARGWPEYKWRWRGPAAQVRPFTQPRWDGRLLDGERVLLFAEQGLGDTMQFVRYAPLVQARGGVVLVECPSVLAPLLRRCPGIDRVVPQGTALPDFAYQAPFLSLPMIFQTTLATVPAVVPYLSAEPAGIAAWGAELAALPGVKIGICWQGSKKYQGDAHRSIPLRHFAALAAVPGIHLVSLQKGEGAEQLDDAGFPVLDLGERLDAGGAFLDTAAVLPHVDLVVSSDTAVVHLAGALGVPVWMATSMAADWRWMRVRDDSPWYPTLRLFRQTRWGDWDEAFARIAAALRQRHFGQTAPITTEIAPGELLDKITILEIKRARMYDESKLDNVRIELGTLLAALARALKPSPELAALTAQLKTVNEALWAIEDAIRLQEQAQEFSPRFIELARSVYQNNDQRAALKRAINDLLGARLREEKSYAGEK